MIIDEVINGNNIDLRQLTLLDVNQEYHSWMNDEEVTQFLEARFSDTSIEGIKGFVKSVLESNNNVFLAIIKKENNKHIGNIKLGPIDFNHKTAVLGIIIGDKREWGKGYGLEAIKLICQHGFEKLNLHKITAGCYENNLGSKKMFEKAGFVIEGIQKKQYRYKGEYVDKYLFGRIDTINGDLSE